MLQEDRIRLYLDNQLSDAERQAFERELLINSELQEETDFYREMYGFFEQRVAVVALKGVLQHAETKLFEPPTPPKKKIKPLWIGLFWIIGVGLLLLSFLYFFFIKPSFSAQEQSSIEQQTTIEPLDFDTTQRTSLTADTTHLKTEEPSLKTPPILNKKQEIIDNETPPKEIMQDIQENEPSQPIADAGNFSPSPMLEMILDKNVRANIVFTIANPAHDTTFLNQDGFILMNIEGIANVPMPVILSIYDNKPSNFDNDYKMLSTEIIPQPLEDNTYRLYFSAKIPLDKGLYYMILRDKQTNEMRKIQRFYVR